MSYDSATDAIYGRLNDLISAVQGVQAEAHQLSLDAAAISMANVAADCEAVKSALNGSLSVLQEDARVLADVRVSG